MPPDAEHLPNGAKLMPCVTDKAQLMAQRFLSVIDKVQLMAQRFLGVIDKVQLMAELLKRRNNRFTAIELG